MQLPVHIEPSGSQRRRHAMRVAVVSLSLLATLGLGACQHGQGPGKGPGRRGGHRGPVPVTLGSVVRQDVPFEVSAIGHVEASSTVNVTSRVGGTLQKVAFHEGARVHTGDLLFTIDPRPFRIAIERAKAQLAHDDALVTNAREELRRYKGLVAQQYAPQQQLDQTRANLRSLQASLQADRAAIDDAKLQLSYCTIRAPMDGVTGDLLVHAGNLVKANDSQPLVVIRKDLPVVVRFSVPEQHLDRIRARMAQAGVQLSVAATPSGWHGAPAEGSLTFVDNTVDTSTGTIALKATFANQDKRLWPGQFVRVALQLYVEKAAVVCPARAVQHGQMGTFVFKVQAGKPGKGGTDHGGKGAMRTVQVQPVTVERSTDHHAVITRGLQPGDVVVTDGQLRLHEGAQIEAAKANGAAGSAE